VSLGRSRALARALWIGACLVAGGWWALWPVWTGVFVSVAAAAAAVPWAGRWRSRRKWWIVAGLLTLPLCARLIASELAARWHHLAEIKNTTGPTGFSPPALAALYGWNLTLAAGGFVVGFDEVARETLALTRAGPRERVWESAFALRSPKVRQAVVEMARDLPREARDGARHTLPTRTVAWTEYSTASDSLRVALALNSPLVLSGVAERRNRTWWMDLRARAAIAYPRSALLRIGPVLGSDPLTFDEGLFWVLQERGWLHPYTVTWMWSMPADEERLRDLHTPYLSLRERLAAFAWRRVR